MKERKTHTARPGWPWPAWTYCNKKLGENGVRDVPAGFETCLLCLHFRLTAIPSSPTEEKVEMEHRLVRTEGRPVANASWRRAGGLVGPTAVIRCPVCLAPRVVGPIGPGGFSIAPDGRVTPSFVCSAKRTPDDPPCEWHVMLTLEGFP